MDLLRVSAFLFLAACCAADGMASTCLNDDEACAATETKDEVGAMRVELLQQRRSGRVATSREDDALETTEELTQRREEILAELRQTDADLLDAASAGNHSLAGSCQGSCGTSYNPGKSCQCNVGCRQHRNCCQDFETTCGVCSEIGCGHYFNARLPCQCNQACASHNSCCKDYSSSCASSPSSSSTCKAIGCGKGYDSSAPCQCNKECARFNSCCSDYTEECEAPSPSPGGPPAPPAAPGSLPMGHPTPGKAYPQHKGFTLFLVEEFDAPLDLNNDPIWTWGDGAMSQVRFVKENVRFEGGKMKIVVDHNNGHQEACSHSFAESISHKPLRSGEFRTKHNMFRYGRYEMSHKAPTVDKAKPYLNGNYISTMFTYRDLNEHHWREVDWEITGDTPHSITTNVLVADNTIKWNPSIQRSTHGTYHWADTRNAFHEYAFEWLPDKITWYVDGKQIREQKGNIPDLSTKIMMNLWIFDAPSFAFGGKDGRNNKYPMNSEYDWFRFYKWDGDSKYPCQDESCLTSEDRYLSGNNPCDGIEMVGRHHGWPCQARCN